ncbi:MAG: hypothetical protein IJD05_02935, partial [Bacteroidaceae bacterium]|nr:hypothetical protein [Bacteroidaceae bacterium]
MENQTKLILKGIAVDGIPFAKEIRSLNEVKSSGSYVVICKNANSDNGLPQINGKSHSCFCCEAQLNVTCCYSEDETQSNTAYGQTLTICDRETGATNTYTRTISPGKNDGRWSEWKMAAIGDIQLIEQNNDIVNAFTELSKNMDSAVNSVAALHFNYMGNYPFSQKVLEVGADKMIIAGYLDIEYEDGKAYCFSVVSPSSNALSLYKKEKDLPRAEANVTYLFNFTVSKIDGSPYYLAKASFGNSPKSWLILDWDNVKDYYSLYDYDGIALSPSLFKGGGLSGRMEQTCSTLSESISIESAKLNNRINAVEGELKDVCYSELDYNNSSVVNQFQTDNEVGAPLFSSSTFSGAAMYVGELAPFRYILSYFKAADWVESPKPITKILLQIRQNDHTGVILYNQTIYVNIQPGEVKAVLVDLGEIKTFTGNLYVALRADTFGTPLRPAASNYPFEPADGTTYPSYYYWVNGDMDETDIGRVNSNKSGRNFYFQTFNEIKKTSFLTERIVKDVESRLNLNPGVEISLPDKIVA